MTFMLSTGGTLHMEDTTPLPIGTVGTPNVIAAPTRSLWQTDTLGLRLTTEMSWTRSGRVATCSTR